MTSRIGEGLKVEGRVLLALMLREIHTINGSSRLGYLWVLIQSAFGIGVFWALRAVMGASAPHGISMPLFLVAGFSLWGVFSGCISRCMSAVDGNRALLTFPQVTVFDVMLARVLVITATEILTGAVIVGASVLAGFPFEPASAALFFFVLVSLPLLGLGIGMVLASLAVYVPVIEKVVPMVMRVLFFVSGVFFGVSAFSHKVAEILLWNPVFQAIELLRESLHVAYRIEGLSPFYLGCCTVVMLVLGGFLERFTRARRLSQ